MGTENASLKEDAVRVGLYIVRAPASASRLQLAEGGLLKYLAKGSVANDRCDPLFEPNGQVLDPLGWIARVTLHIPDQGSQIVRYNGHYSNASRGKAARRDQPPSQTTQSHAPEDSQSQYTKERKASWAALIKLIYEADPLLRPNCHTHMKIISVIKDADVIDKILDHLQYKFEVLPLPARSPPPDCSHCDPHFPLDPPVWTEGD